MSSLARPWPVRVALAHPRTLAGIAVGVLAVLLLPGGLQPSTRGILGWDAGALAWMVMVGVLFAREGDDAQMAANAKRQQDGEWTILWVTLAGVLFSFVALTTELGDVKGSAPGLRSVRVGLVGVTLLLSWLVTHTIFALRYAHEYYDTSPGRTEVDGGLEFPGDAPPDYWDFMYFSVVLGMTFQVSDVQITSRKLRRLATVHGLIGFLFNTVIVALTVNIAASLLS